MLVDDLKKLGSKGFWILVVVFSTQVEPWAVIPELNAVDRILSTDVKIYLAVGFRDVAL